MIHFLDLDNELHLALIEVLREIPNAEKLSGSFHVKRTGEGIHIYKNNEEGIIEYSDRRSLMRAAAIVAEHAEKEKLDIWEKPSYEILCAMPDVSRNAVPKVESLKKLCRILALEGYNALMLYTEDTYELEGYPYFGHLRGRYTEAELREIDEYAGMLGIELIPSIQTLAHLNGFFEWPLMEYLRDCNDILLVGDEKVYQLIDKMLETISRNIKSRKINIGLDEAFMLGSGKYLERFGYKKRWEIMKQHLEKVLELCKKYEYEPRMWSDMFFRTINQGVYRVPGTDIPQHIVESVPEEVTLVYWDYVQPQTQGYDEMFRQHKAFRNRIAFAGGDASWYGLVPLNCLAKQCALSAIKSIENNGIEEVYITMWKDDGAACSIFSSMSTLFFYGEACWGSSESCEQRAKKRLEVCTGMDAELLLSLEEVNHLPGRVKFGETVANPSRYIFYDNILTGKFDYHIPTGSGEHFAKQVINLKASMEKAGNYAYLLEPIIGLCEVLALKAELGKQLKDAYGNENREEVKQISKVKIPKLIESVQAFRKVFRKQWMLENKSIGFDVMDIRIGGLLCQLETAQTILDEWLEGSRQKVDELEASRLPYDGKTNKGYDNDLILVNRWERMAAQNISNMFGV